MKQMMNVGELAFYDKKRMKCVMYQTPKNATLEMRMSRCKLCAMKPYGICMWLRCSREVRGDRHDVFFAEYPLMSTKKKREHCKYFRKDKVVVLY